MYPKSLQNLTDLFVKFPGIGPRQASRFVFYILKSGMTGELISAISELNEKVIFCTQCFRATEKEGGSLCAFCRDSKREQALIAVVEKESDLQNLEKTGSYSGLYHVLGGVIDPLDSQGPQLLHLKELFSRIKTLLEKGGSGEVILATNPTTEGDTTALYIERILAPLKNNHPGLKISRLGRGLSLGSELEHVDEVTLKNALTNRK